MKQPFYWTRRITLVALLFVLAGLILVKWVVPVYLVRTLERLGGGLVKMGETRITVPLTTTLSRLQLANNSEQSALSVQRVVMTPLWYWPMSRTLFLHSVDVDRPLVRFTRTEEGTKAWPTITGERPTLRRSFMPPTWRIRVNQLTISAGVLEFVDEKPATPFRGALEHVSLTVGPVLINVDREGVSVVPATDAVSSFAARGKFVGFEGASAPLYCSGWIDASAKDLQASCSLEPLALSAFDPYYHGTPEFRVYTATLKSTSQWTARANELTGRLQLDFDNIGEGDMSVGGRTIIDIKKFTSRTEPRLRGEIFFTGPLDQPRKWQAEFLPGDDTMQSMVRERLLEYGVKMIRFPLLRINLTHATEGVVADIEAASREVHDALEMLARPVPVELPKVKRYGPWPSHEQYLMYEEPEADPSEEAATEEDQKEGAPAPAAPEPDEPRAPDAGAAP